MGAQKESLAGRAYQAVVEIGGEVTTTAIFHYMGLQTRVAEKTALNALSDMTRAGRLVRVKNATYSLPPKTGLEPVSKQERMWAVLRMRKRVTVADLQELAEVSDEYAKEWLRVLAKREVVKRIDHPSGNKPSVWQLINDTVTMPDLTDNAEQLRALRAKRLACRQQLAGASLTVDQASRDLSAALGIAYKAIESARDALEELGADDN